MRQNCEQIEPMSSKRYKLACAPNKDSDQSLHQRSLIRVFDGPSMDIQGLNDSSFWKRMLWSDCVDAHVDLSLRLAEDST